MNAKSLLTRRQQAMGSAYRLFYDNPVHLVRGEGAWLFDAEGRRYLDMYNNVPHVGHCHPRVVEAICSQAGTLNTHTRYLHDNIVECAERLTGKLPPELDTAMFCCTGSEANELALRIARSATGRKGVIVADYAYHGNTQAIYEITTSDIPAEDLPRLFERFYRVEKSRDRARGGVGIGLAIVKQLVEGWGGRVGAESSSGLTRFWFSLPQRGSSASGVPR